MQWVFLDDQGQYYDLDAPIQWEHGAAVTFDYLMPVQSEKLNNPATLEEVVVESNTSAHSYRKAYPNLWTKLEDRSIFISTVYEYLLRGELIELPEGAARYVVAMYGMEPEVHQKIRDGASCMTPWNYYIEDWASVLAYEQRADAPFICNIQRRTCQNGKLSGNFTQVSCDENLKWNQKNFGYLTHNADLYAQESIQGDINAQEKRKNWLQEQGYIQPNEPLYDDANFNLNGKRAPNPSPITMGESTDNAVQDDIKDVPLAPQARQRCETPRGEQVQAGHFVKAYRFQNGFIDIPCQVQIRLCVDGQLEWTHQYASCRPRETSFEDFRHGYLDDQQPSPQRLLKFLEYDFWGSNGGTQLDQETAEAMADWLREQET